MVRSLSSLQSEYREKTPRSYAQWKKGIDVMPGGVIKGAYWYDPYPIYIDSAEGCHIFDIDGNKYLDFANHHSTMIVGHNHPNVVQAVAAELQKGLGFGGPTKLEEEISSEIVARFPAIDKVRFTNSGTESSLHATRIVRAHSGKQKIAKFEGAYHGSHDAVEVSSAPPLNKAGSPEMPNAVPAWPGMSKDSETDIIILPYNDMESVEAILTENKDDIAGVFYDGRAGMLDIPIEFSKFVRKITKDLGILMIMDEVVSFRAGVGGYQGYASIEPDLSIFGKVVGGGLPVGAIGGKSKLMDVVDTTKDTGLPTVNQSGSFSGNSLTLAAGLATLKALTPEAYSHLDNITNQLHIGMEKVFNQANIPCQVVSVGSMLNPFISTAPIRDYRALAGIDTDLTNRIHLGLLLKGVHIGRVPMSFCLSTPTQDSDIQKALDVLAEVLDEA